MLVTKFVCLVVTAGIGQRGPATPCYERGVVTVVSDSEPVLTTDVLARMTTFWALFRKEPVSIRDTAASEITKPITIGDGQQQMSMSGFIDMVAMAAQYPSVAADLKKAGLTAQQWEEYRKAIYIPTINQFFASTHNRISAFGMAKNIAFLQSHPKELNALKATGMPFPPSRYNSSMGY